MNRPLDRLPGYPAHCPTGKIWVESTVLAGKRQCRVVLTTQGGERYNVTSRVAPHLKLAANPLIDLPPGNTAAFLSRVERASSDYINYLHVNRQNTLRAKGDFETMDLPSLGEELTRLVLEKAYRTQFPTQMPEWLNIDGKGRELDGYAVSANIAFEYQGSHHTTNPAVQTVDLMKAELCAEHGVRLLTVPHEDRRIAAYVNETRPEEQEKLFQSLLRNLTVAINYAVRGQDGLALVRLEPSEVQDIRQTFDKMATVTRARRREVAPEPSEPVAVSAKRRGIER